jgi:signal peptidase I
MEPTLHSNDRLIVKKTHNNNTLKRFDIIVFKKKKDKSKLLIKRIVGLYGENIDIKNNIVFINGSKLYEPFLINTSNIKSNTLKRKGEFSYKDLNGFFLLGDNRNISRDSRTFGLISKDNVIGKAIFTYFPFRRLN